MIYVRYNELVNGDQIMVYKPTDITGEGEIHPVTCYYDENNTYHDYY